MTKNPLILLWEVDVNENDSNNRFRTGSRNNSIFAHVQRKMAKDGYEGLLIIKTFNSYRKEGLRNPLSLSELQLEAQKLTLVHVQLIWSKINSSILKLPQSQCFYSKST